LAKLKRTPNISTSKADIRHITQYQLIMCMYTSCLPGARTQVGPIGGQIIYEMPLKLYISLDYSGFSEIAGFKMLINHFGTVSRLVHEN